MTTFVKKDEIAKALAARPPKLDYRAQKVLQVGDQFAPLDSESWPTNPATISDALEYLNENRGTASFTKKLIWDYSQDGASDKNLIFIPAGSIVTKVYSNVQVAIDQAAQIKLGASTLLSLPGTIGLDSDAPDSLTTINTALSIHFPTSPTVGKVTIFVTYLKG